MARHVKISVIGAALHGRRNGSPLDAAIAHLRAQIDQVLPDCPDLIVMPEFCDQCSGDDLPTYRDFAARHGEQVLDCLAKIARKHSTWITYPALRAARSGGWRNSIQLINRQGIVQGTYDKNCLTLAELEAGITCGTDAPAVQTEFGRVGMAICFDLNFDELRTRIAQASPDLVLFCSMYHGGLMQQYWAYSCRSHFVAACAGLPSSILSPIGQHLAETTNYFNHVTTVVNLDCCIAHLDFNVAKLADLKRKYGPGVKIVDPGLLAPVLISSEVAEVGVEEMCCEFGIEQLDDYFDRCRQVWHGGHVTTAK